ncbi:MAG: translation initiation factor IF-2 [Methanothrix soehngenii]|jgi:translation initiation factor 5B|uniref:translation initiation factor IF-2 n=1 Tax=Methanothrix soehngenii TaxID=2223 RepID=UPI0023F1EA84|nr:translation initiation factor IF-2 [Methanothrix soehngenii]MCK9585291.1 translation initiation factor IF-2 [Methanothrix soehngenii]MDD3974638.1 translation initiation factor IF-2 [Methanothrix soehngenii]MDD4488215.1 translation initiation factor IF-2 [Methanothrix soehngenii]MDD5256362.1 translation initiation factor IF-2 [Methanothrix soehngenii]MDD5733875.1 translation initiation factor IF-2 [Methanothrix soehngenii]
MQQKSKKAGKAKGKQSNLRTPIVVVMGHVDHGKTTLLDKIRGTAVAKGEAGLITQHIGATEVPLDVVQDFCGSHFGKEIEIPGLLFIDTPGHHAFTSMRSRGGSLADLAVLIVDVNEGFQPQTIESLSILKRFKTPFVVAANKMDRIGGWHTTTNAPFAKSLKVQSERVSEILDTRLYELVGELYKYGFDADRYDRITDFTRTVGIVPISAITGEGVPDLLMILVGLAQRFLKDNLQLTATGPGVGTILEVKEEKGLGTTLDVILYNGEFFAGDTVIVGTSREPLVTKIRALLKPKPLAEIRSEERFLPVKHVSAASGVKVSAPKLDNALAGSTIRVVSNPDEVEALSLELKSELDAVRIDTESEGLIIKSDTIGSLEALVGELKARDIHIHYADVGPISRRDVIRAAAINDPLLSAILGFNVDILPDALNEIQKTNVPVFSSDIIYTIIESYERWVEDQKNKMEQERLEAVIRPGAVRILPDCVFRQSKPAVVGVQVIGGIVRTQVNLMREDGANVGVIKGIQAHNENQGSATVGQEVAVSIDGPTVGRQIHEGDILYVNIPEKHARIVELELKPKLAEDEREVLENFLEIKRKKDPFWGR